MTRKQSAEAENPAKRVILDPKYTADQIAEHQQRVANGNGAHHPYEEIGFDLSKTSGPLVNLNNARLALERDPNIKDIVWYDEFLQRIMTDEKNPREWTDADDIKLAIYFQAQLGIPRMSQQIVSAAVVVRARDRTRNCVRDWLDSLEWDGQERLAHFFPLNFGTRDSEYARAVGRNFFIGMVARIYQPGCQVKNMVILEGVQDASKSSALNLLVGDRWFSEQHESVMSKGFFEVLQGKWLIEIPEMDSFSRAETSRVKAVVSCRSDRYRVPWDRHASDHPRQCIFCGTTNKEEGGVFNDDTGAVRFWPIACVGNIDMRGIASQREQLFAEAVRWFRAGQAWWLIPREEAEAEQTKRFVQDVWHDSILERAAFLFESGSQVTITQLLSDLGKKTADQNRADQMRVASCLKLGGYKRRQASGGKWHYIRE